MRSGSRTSNRSADVSSLDARNVNSRRSPNDRKFCTPNVISTERTSPFGVGENPHPRNRFSPEYYGLVAGETPVCVKKRRKQWFGVLIPRVVTSMEWGRSTVSLISQEKIHAPADQSIHRGVCSSKGRPCVRVLDSDECLHGLTFRIRRLFPSSPVVGRSGRGWSGFNPIGSGVGCQQRGRTPSGVVPLVRQLQPMLFPQLWQR